MLGGLEIFASASVLPAAPATSLNVRIGPHRRVAWARSDLRRFRDAGRALDATVNDVVLAVVAGALGRYLRRRGEMVDGLRLSVMVPVSVRMDAERGALGNRVSAIWVHLPVDVEDIRGRLKLIAHETAEIKRSGQALSAQALTELTGFAPTTILAQAARLQAHQRLFNLVVTNVPGPQRALYLLGHRLETVYPMVPLAENTALGIALMSYDGQLSFGLTADYDVLWDIDRLVDDLHASIAELGQLSGGGATLSDGRGRRPSSS